MSKIQSMAAQVTGQSGQPDIAYTPNLEIYQQRLKRRQETEELDTTLPDGFPHKLHSHMAWTSTTVSDQYGWVYELSEPDLDEIQQALDIFKGNLIPCHMCAL